MWLRMWQGCNCDKDVLALAAAQNTPADAVATRMFLHPHNWQHNIISGGSQRSEGKEEIADTVAL